MKILKYIGFGALIWAVAFIIVCVFVGFKIPTDDISVKLITSGASVLTAVLLARSLKLPSNKQAFLCAIAWLLTGIILDIVITVQFTGWEIFTQWNVIVVYILGFIVPFLAVNKKK